MIRYGEEDTIAAISTAVSEAGIGIIRISGPDACRIADRVFRSPGGKKKLTEVPSHTIHFGYLIDPAREREEGKGQDHEGAIDQVLVSVMRGPRSYTAEDVVEINCHGGVLLVQKALEAVLAAGARPAQPGEFTKRAYLNGRIDLTEAEAVMDLIQSKNRSALQHALGQLQGSLYEKIETIRREMLYQSAQIEACLDNPDALSFDDHKEEFAGKVSEWLRSLRSLLATADSGRLIQDGIRTVIVGKPNAGKSSLLNLLLGEDRAIVTPVAGTTRDLLTETITIEGLTLAVTDTAGIRDTEDPVERIGVRKAREAVERADLILYLIDSSTSIDMEDQEILGLIQGKKTVILLNKTDLEPVTDLTRIRERLTADLPVLPFSAKERKGLEDLVIWLKETFFSGALPSDDQVVITNARHKVLLQRAEGSLVALTETIRAGMTEDFYTVDLMDAYEALGEMTGKTIGEDLADEIFRRFCMGK